MVPPTEVAFAFVAAGSSVVKPQSGRDDRKEQGGNRRARSERAQGSRPYRSRRISVASQRREREEIIGEDVEGDDEEASEEDEKHCSRSLDFFSFDK